MPQNLSKLLNRLSFRQLQVFDSVARSGSYSKAANQLGLTQPAVSSQIRQLETALGQPLFEYVSRRLYRTAAGERLLQSTRQIFSELQHLQMQMADIEGQIRGELRLAAVSTAQYLVPLLLKDFLPLYPQITIKLTVVNRAQALERLTNNEDDLVIMGMVPENRALNFMPFLDNQMVAVVPAQHPLLEEQELSVQQFLDSGLILREPGSGTRLALESFCTSQRLRLEGHMELGSNTAVKHAVTEGLGVAVLPVLGMQAELALGWLKILPLPGFPLRRSWCTVYPEGKHPTPVIHAFLNYVRTNMNVLEQKTEAIYRR